MTKLKSCPFCGKENMRVSKAEKRYEDDELYRWKVCCLNCGAMVGYFLSAEDAIVAWNRRPDNVVELPCKVGDTVYAIEPVCGDEDYVCVNDIYIDTIACEIWDPATTDGGTEITINGYLNAEDVYFTREEAEKALIESCRGDDYDDRD